VLSKLFDVSFSLDLDVDEFFYCKVTKYAQILEFFQYAFTKKGNDC
jgi:hypothetical protein